MKFLPPWSYKINFFFPGFCCKCFSTRNQFISNLVIDPLKRKELLKQEGRSKETVSKQHIDTVTFLSVKLSQNNENMTLLRFVIFTDAACFLQCK